VPALAAMSPALVRDNESVPVQHLALPEDNDIFLATLGAIAPGTALRDGLERILRGRTGALIVLGHTQIIDSMSGGGFVLDVEFSSTRLRELAKMDGAVILDQGATKILRAGVQLLPDGALPTNETGTRHRTADRVSQQSGLAVLSVSKSMHTIALYVRGHRHVVEDSAKILSRSNQALATLERYKQRLVEVSGALSALEIEDLVTVRDIAVVAQRLEMVRRIASEIADSAVELGTDGRLVSLQHDELVAGVEEERVLITRDYIPAIPGFAPDLYAALSALDALSATDLLDLGLIASALGIGATQDALDLPATPRGYRLLARVPRLPEYLVDRLAEHFGELQKLLAATTDDLQFVDGIGEMRARSIRESLSRIAESSYVDRLS
jgi:diadenylate cyclase